MKKTTNTFLFSFFYQMSLMKKLLLSYSVFILLPMVLLAVFSYNRVSRTLVEQFKYSAALSLQQNCRYLNKNLEEIVYATDKLAFNSSLTGLFDGGMSSEPMAKVFEKYSAVSKLIKNELDLDMIYSAAVYVEGNPYFIAESSTGRQEILFVSRDSAEAEMLEKELEKFSGKILWLPRSMENVNSGEEIKVITAVRYMKSIVDYKTDIGIIAVNIEEDTLRTFIDFSAILPGSLSLLLDADKNILAVSDESLYEEYGLSSEFFEWELALDYQSFQKETTQWLLNTEKVSSTGWTLVSVLPYSEILRSSRETRNNMMIIIIVVTLIFYFIAFAISQLIGQRLKGLSVQMRAVQFDNYQPISTDGGTDEISDLIDSYNYMLDKINAYAHSQYEMGMEIKASELRALQAQINPHFLYNTLDLLYCIAWENDVKDITEIVSLLTKFYKLSLNKGLEMITVADAVELVRTYIGLQNYRFESNIQLVEKLSPEIYEYKILKLLLQPIVENAVMHGILEKRTRCGTITISAEIVDDTMYVTISDDGVGMTEEQIEAVMQEKEPESVSGRYNTHMGYGISNVIERIRLYYGEQYGLKYESCPGEGTSVLLWIPIAEMSKKC